MREPKLVAPTTLAMGLTRMYNIKKNCQEESIPVFTEKGAFIAYFDKQSYKNSSNECPKGGGVLSRLDDNKIIDQIANTIMNTALECNGKYTGYSSKY